MRRKDKEKMGSDFLDSVLAEAEWLCLALNTGAAPYPVILNFVYMDGALFVHGANVGYKLDLVRADPRVGFTMATDICIVPEQFTTKYRSVSGQGRISPVDDPAEKQAVFAALTAKYHASCPKPVPEALAGRIAVLRIDIESMTGKHSLGKV